MRYIFYYFLVLLLPLVTEVFLKLLLITDHPTIVADAILHYFGNTEMMKKLTIRYVCTWYCA